MSWVPGSGLDWGSASLSVAFGAGPACHGTPPQPNSANPTTHGSPPDTADLRARSCDADSARQQARSLHGQGYLREATALQERILADTVAAGDAQVDDYLFLGLLLHGARQLAKGVAVLRDGIARFPASAPLHENLGVFLLGLGDAGGAVQASEAALLRGSASPNVHDCLAHAYSSLGRMDLSVQSGRAALEAKDRFFGSRHPVAEIPQGLPPAFNPLNPAENIIAYCLWGDDPRYRVPLAENARIRPHLFPCWTMRVYHDPAVDPGFLEELAALGAELRPMQLPAGWPAHRRLLWRFDVAADPFAKRFLCRDADSLLSVKERVAVDAWLQSDRWFHAMRDWYTHTDLLLAGMWGGVANVLPDVMTLLNHYQGWRMENDHIDQDLLAETVWPSIRHNILIHDSVYAPCLGSVPFPPYGMAPPGHHIGQNAFMHFKQHD